MSKLNIDSAALKALINRNFEEALKQPLSDESTTWILLGEVQGHQIQLLITCDKESDEWNPTEEALEDAVITDVEQALEVA